MSHAYALCTGLCSGAVSIGHGRALVSVQGDGVSCYDIGTRKPVQAWALGAPDQEFSAPAVYDYATNLCFAPVRPRAGGANTGGSVLAWSADDTAGSITQLAHAIHLPPLHALFPVSHTPEGEEEEAAAAAAEEREGEQVDGSGDAAPGAIAALAGGGAALCSGEDVVAEAGGARGQHTVAACYQRGVMVVVAAESKAGGATRAAVFRVKGGQLEEEPPVELVPPAAGCRAVAATATPERTAVLWSDGSVAFYLVPGDERPLVPGPDHDGPGRRHAAVRRLAGFSLPSPGKAARGSGGKRRGSGGAEPDVAAGGVAMAAMGPKQVAVAGWATGGDGAAVLRLVVLETGSACVQAAADFGAADVGLAALDTSKPVQVASLGVASNQLAISVGTAVLVAALPELRPPTLANLLGALELDAALDAMRRGGGGGGGGGDGLLPAPPLGLDAAGAGVNPAALAAARVLHADELAALCEPFGGAPRPVDVSCEPAEPVDPGQWLVPAKVHWRCTDEQGDAEVAAEERRVWAAVQANGAPELRADAALAALLAPLLELRRSTGLALSPRLVCRLLLLAAEHGHWDSVGALLQAQHPGVLTEVPGLAAAAADAGRLDVAEALLSRGCDEAAGELAALLRVLLSPPSSEAARQGRLQRHAAAEAAAAAAQQAARAAADGRHDAEQQQQQQQGQQGQQRKKGGQPPPRRQRRRAAAEAGGANGALQPPANGTAGQHAAPPEAEAQAAAEEPLAAPLAAPGARERAVAACCAAAVEGFTPDEVCLHAAVAAPANSRTLHAALRGLGGEHALRLLRYLAALLRQHGARVGACAVGWRPPLALPAGAALPPADAALSWAAACLDTNLMALSHEPESVALASELRAAVDEQAAALRPLLRLRGAVAQVLAAAAAAQSRSAAAAADYSVQWLDLRVVPPEQREQLLHSPAAPQ